MNETTQELDARAVQRCCPCSHLLEVRYRVLPYRNALCIVCRPEGSAEADRFYRAAVRAGGSSSIDALRQVDFEHLLT